jgi:hypothetical protein
MDAVQALEDRLSQLNIVLALRLNGGGALCIANEQATGKAMRNWRQSART